MVSLQCVVVGKEEGSFNVEIDDGANVSKLKDAIKEQGGGLITVPPSTMQLFLAKTDRRGWLDGVNAAACDDPASQGFKRMKTSSLLKNSESFGEGFRPSKGQVHVLVVDQDPAPVKLQTTGWKKAKEMYPVLDFQESTQPFIHIPRKYAEGSGLSRVRKDGLHLYLRSELKEEWKALHASVVRTYAVQWIVGPSGTGKSCAAFAFACSMKRGSDWDVLWIACNKGFGHWLSCILFRGVEKWTCKCRLSELFSILNSLRKNVVVFVDGYENDQYEPVLDSCWFWQEKDLECRRLVIVSSMLSTGEDFRPEKFNKIASAVASSLWSLTTSTPDDSPGKMDILQRFILPSWTLEEYKTALANDDFFEHVRLNFTDSDAPMSLEERHKLLDAKFFVVGGNARMMFDMGTEEAMGHLRLAMGNITPPLSGSNCIGMVNLLFAWYRCGGGTSLVSSFVARETASQLSPQNVFCPSTNDFNRETFTRLVSQRPAISTQVRGLLGYDYVMRMRASNC